MRQRVNREIERGKELVRERTARERVAIVAGIVVAIGLIPLSDPGFFVMNVFIFVFLFAILGHSWNIIGGYAGQLSLGHAVFFGVGAYTTTILFLFYGITPIGGLWIAGLVAAAVGLFVGAVTFRLRGHYFAMATLAIALITRSAFFRWEWVGGSAGLEFPFSEVGTLYSLTFTSKAPYFYLIGGFALLVTLLMYVMDRSKLGIYLEAINMDQTLARNAGLNVFWYKMYALGLSAFVSGIGGGFYALYITFIDPPSTLNLFRNVEPIIIALIGGTGTVLGPLVGALLFVPVNEYSRTFLSGSYTGMGWVVFGFVIVVFAIYRPNGILGQNEGNE